ncbi:hypothetical protein B0H14DRAFT_101947 [Mycena olivaceomarginata]|nr:hypothetical protein B0H14DRAFT_101947 [Mycena olivaceomarginata]
MRQVPAQDSQECQLGKASCRVVEALVRRQSRLLWASIHAFSRPFRFTALPNRVPENYTRQPPPASKRFTKQRATDAHDVLASVLAPPAEPLHFPPPVGALPAVSSNGRGELRGSVPLFHIAIPNGASSSSSAVPHNASASGSSGRRPGANTAQSNRRRAVGPAHTTATDTGTHLTTEAPVQPPLSPPGLLPSAIPRTPEHDERLAARIDSSAISPLVGIPPLQEHDDVEESEAALLRAYDVAGANAYEMLGYDDEDEGAGHPLGLAHFLADKATMASFHNLRALSITFAESDFNHIHASIASFPAIEDLILDLRQPCTPGPDSDSASLSTLAPLAPHLHRYKGPVALLPLVLRGSHPKHLTLTQRGGSATELLKTLLRTRCDTKSVSSLAIRVALHADICADPRPPRAARALPLPHPPRDPRLFGPHWRTRVVGAPHRLARAHLRPARAHPHRASRPADGRLPVAPRADPGRRDPAQRRAAHRPDACHKSGAGSVVLKTLCGSVGFLKWGLVGWAAPVVSV